MGKKYFKKNFFLISKQFYISINDDEVMCKLAFKL